MAKIFCLFLVALSLKTCYAIVDGITAVDAQFPYVVSLQERSQLTLATRGHSCAGALITFQHVVTTAACLYNYNTATLAYVLKTPANFRVFAGSVNLANDASVDRWRSISSFNPHPDYMAPPSYVNNIGIIVLQTAFPNNTAVIQPIALSTAAQPDFTECTVAGWGANSGSIIPLPTAYSLLQYANKYIYSQTLCSSIHNPQSQIPNILPTMVCAAMYNTNAVSCNNDTGNPLVCNGQLTGVLSWFPTCVATSWPEVYTRTSNYTVWIRSLTGAAPGNSAMVVVVLVSAVLVQIFNVLS